MFFTVTESSLISLTRAVANKDTCVLLPMDTFTWPTKISMSPISVYTLPAPRPIEPAETVAVAVAPMDVPSLVLVGETVTVESSLVVVVLEPSCLRSRAAEEVAVGDEALVLVGPLLVGDAVAVVAAAPC